MKIIVIEDQSLVDIALQEHGKALVGFELALLNGFSLTDDLFPGQKLEKAESLLANTDTANYFRGKGQMISCGSRVSAGNLPIKPVGIGAMIIENDFIVG